MSALAHLVVKNLCVSVKADAGFDGVTSLALWHGEPQFHHIANEILKS